MIIFQRNLRKFAENIRKFIANFQKICPKKPGSLNRSGGNSPQYLQKVKVAEVTP